MIKEPINRLYNGELSFEAFVLQTKGYWRKHAARLISKWDVPPSVSVDDLVQEMLMSCWTLLDSYEPDKSELHRYIIFNAINSAKRWMNKQREAKYYMDKSVSRYPQLYGDLDDIKGLSSKSIQEEVLTRLEKLDLAINIKELLILYHLSNTPSIDIVANNLYSNPSIRYAMRFNSLSDARRIVYRSVFKLSKRSKSITNSY